MRRRRSFLQALLLWSVLGICLGYVGLAVFGPMWLYDRLQRIPGQPLTIESIRVTFPATVVLSDVRLAQENPGTLITAAEIAVSPRWLSWPHRTLWLKKLKVHGLFLQARRTAKGTVLQPVPEILVPTAPPAPTGAKGVVVSPALTPWRVVIETLQINDGAIEFVDEKNVKPFTGSATRMFVVGGPVSVPFEGDRLTFAVQGVLSGAGHHAASLYCSGWADVQNRGMDVSCQLEPLRLAAFEPYYQRPLPKKLYDVRISARSRFLAKANEVEGRIQLEIDEFSEADLASLGKAGEDIKKLAGAGQRTLTGELHLSGSFDRPSEWKWQLVPGNELVQRLVSPLLERGIELIRIRIGSLVVPIGLVPATEATKADSEAAKQQVQDALSIIAPSAPAEPPPPAAPAPSPTSAGTPSASPTPGEAKPEQGKSGVSEGK